MRSAILFSLPKRVFNATVLCTTSVLQFLLLPNETRKEKDITKLKPLVHSEMQNILSSTYVDGFTVNTTAKVV